MAAIADRDMEMEYARWLIWFLPVFILPTFISSFIRNDGAPGLAMAAVIIGETIIPAKRIWLITFAVVVGAVLYKLFIQVALSSDTLRSIGFGPQDLNLITALLVVLALVLPKAKNKFLSRKVRA